MPPAEGHGRRKGGEDLRYRHELVEQGRKDLNITQTELATRTGMSQPSLSLIEGGDEWPPSLFNAYRIAKVLGRPMDDYIEEVESDTPRVGTAVIPRAEFERLREIEKQARALAAAVAKEGDPKVGGAVGRSLKKIVKLASE